MPEDYFDQPNIELLMLHEAAEAEEAAGLKNDVKAMVMVTQDCIS